MASLILVLNSGSSTLKASLVAEGADEAAASTSAVWDSESRDATFERVLRELPITDVELRAVAHRVVHGGTRFTGPVLIDDEAISALTELTELAPLHNEVALDVIRLARSRLPDVPHVACFDTAFHASMPEVAWRYPVPAEWADRWGIRRFGFHGLSVEWSVMAAAEILGVPVDALSVVVAHLGSGCSVTAVERGRSVWTSMGFTPLEGLMMGTRSGSIDPGIVLYLLATGRASIAELEAALGRRSGLLGVSGVSADLREVGAAAARGDRRAALAAEMFVARAAEGVAAALTWVDASAIVFTGGIGEHDADTRGAIVERLRLSDEVAVLSIEAREDAVIARAAADLVGP